MKTAPTIHNHFGGGVRQLHPLFDTRFLPENIASLIESVFFALGIVYFAIFSMNTILIISKASNAASFIVNYYASQVIFLFHAESDLITNLIALATTVVIILATKKYFDWAKFNLHPRKD
jgi:hypothetical protein